MNGKQEELSKEILQTKFNVASLEGLNIFYKICKEMFDTGFSQDMIISPDEIEFFDIISKFIGDRKISFDKMEIVKDEMRACLIDLNSYGIRKEEGTELKLEGMHSGFLGGRMCGEIEGRLSTVHNLALSPQKQESYISLLNKSIEDINENVRGFVKEDELVIENELNNIITSLNSHLHEGGKIEIGVVNEVNKRFENYCFNLQNLLSLGDFKGFEDLSMKEKYEKLSIKPAYKLMICDKLLGGLDIKKYYRSRCFLNLNGMVNDRSVDDGSFKTHREILKKTNIFAVPSIIYGIATNHPLVVVGSVIGWLGINGPLRFSELDYKNERPYSNLQNKLEDPSVNNVVKGYIENQMNKI